MRVMKQRRMRWEGYGRNEKFLKNLVGKPERKRLLRRPWHRWKNNIKMDNKI
jgi:hypothetical protein